MDQRPQEDHLYYSCILYASGEKGRNMSTGWFGAAWTLNSTHDYSEHQGYTSLQTREEDFCNWV